MLLTYRSENSKLAEHLACDTFLNSLGDGELELKVRQREVDTLEEALRVTQRFEIVKNVVAYQQSVSTDKSPTRWKEWMNYTR